MLNHNFTCQSCGKEFTDKKNAYRNPKYCSRKCNHKDKRIIQTCLQCQKEFWTRDRGTTYCSHKCRGLYECDQSKRGIFTCEWCNRKFENWKSRPNRFCSAQCRSEFGAKQPRPRDWITPEQRKKNKKAYRGQNWQTVRKEVAKRENNTCQICKRKKRVFERHFDVHHIVPFHSFKKWENANKISNLAYLCRKCHRNVECGHYKLPN